MRLNSGAIRVSGRHEHFDACQQSANCGAVIEDSLGSGVLVSASEPQPQGLSSNPIFPSAIWRLRRQIAEGKDFLVSVTWGYTRLAVARWFTPGYNAAASLLMKAVTRSADLLPADRLFHLASAVTGR